MSDLATAVPSVFAFFAPPDECRAEWIQEACWREVQSAFGDAGAAALEGERRRVARKLLPQDRLRACVGLWLLAREESGWGADVAAGWRRAASGQPLPPTPSSPSASLSHHGWCVATAVAPGPASLCAVGLDVVCTSEVASSLALDPDLVTTHPIETLLAGAIRVRVRCPHSCRVHRPTIACAGLPGKLDAFRAVLSPQDRQHIAAAAADAAARDDATRGAGAAAAAAACVEFAHLWSVKESIGKVRCAEGQARK